MKREQSSRQIVTQLVVLTLIGAAVGAIAPYISAKASITPLMGAVIFGTGALAFGLFRFRTELIRMRTVKRRDTSGEEK